MKSVRVHSFGGPEVLRLEDLPTPAPSTGEIRVKVHAIGVNPVDTYIRSGVYGDRPFPYTPGLDAAGEVDAVGPGVTRWKPKDRVYTYSSVTGAYSDTLICKESQAHLLPPALTYAQGAAIGAAYVTAWYAIVPRAQAKAGETILIHGGSGGVGIAAIQVARAAGLTVYATAGSEKGLTLVREQGASKALDHRAPGYLDSLMTLTGGKGVDIIVEMLANENLGKDLKVLNKKGRVIVVGSRGPVSIDPRDTMGRLADIRGMSIMTISEEELTAAHEAIGTGLASGALRPVVGTELPLSKASQAHEQVMRPGAHGKIVLIP